MIIEVGRHNKIAENERMCQICMYDVECEVHFLYDCPLYRGLRLKYFGPNVQADIVDIMKCENKNSCFNLANFLT